MESWGYLSGLLRAERVHTLKDGFFSALAESADLDACAKALEDTAYGLLFQGKALKEFAQVFDDYFSKRLGEIRESSPCPLLADLYALKADLNNLKMVYKAKQSGREVAWERLSEAGTMPPEEMFSTVQDELYNRLPAPVQQALLELHEKQGDARRVDFLIDKAYYAYRLSLLKEEAEKDEDYKALYEFYRRECDCENIKNLLRAKRMELDKDLIGDLLISGGYISPDFYLDQPNLGAEDTAELIKDTAYGEHLAAGIAEWLNLRSASLLEKQIDEYLLDQLRAFSYIASGPAVAEESLRTLEIELKNLKLIIIGKLNDMSAETIKGRVRNVGI